jgi:hypothetical protein
MTALAALDLDEGLAVRGTVDVDEALSWLAARPDYVSDRVGLLPEDVPAWLASLRDASDRPYTPARTGHFRILPSRPSSPCCAGLDHHWHLLDSTPGRGAFPAVVWWL